MGQNLIEMSEKDRGGQRGSEKRDVAGGKMRVNCSVYGISKQGGDGVNGKLKPCRRKSTLVTGEA